MTLPNNAIIPIGNLSGSITTGGLVPGLPIWTGEASGSIASFPDGSDNPILSLDFSINPVQAAGTPTPSNPLPISGWTGAEIYFVGANIWDELTEIGALNTTTGTETNSPNQIRAKNYIRVKGGSTCYIKNPTGAGNELWILFFDKDKNVLTSGLPSGMTYSNNARKFGNMTMTLPNDCEYIRFYLQVTYGTTYNHDVSITYPSTDINYHPYTENALYNIPFKDSQGNPITIYNGEIHIRRTNGVWSGEIEDKGYYIELGGNLNYQPYAYSGKNGIFVGDVLPVPMNRGLGVANMSNKVGSGGNDGTIWAGVNSKNLYWLAILDILSMTIDQFKTWIDTNHLQLVVYSTTPINTYTINPEDIPNILTKLGYNNLWSDTGDIDKVIYMRNWNISLNILWKAVFG